MRAHPVNKCGDPFQRLRLTLITHSKVIKMCVYHVVKTGRVYKREKKESFQQSSNKCEKTRKKSVRIVLRTRSPPGGPARVYFENCYHALQICMTETRGTFGDPITMTRTRE